jgi:hypothetical protein
MPRGHIRHKSFDVEAALANDEYVEAEVDHKDGVEHTDSTVDNLHELFADLDHNNTGKVDIVELKNVLGGSDHALELMQNLDIYGEGKLTLDDFRTVVQRLVLEDGSDDSISDAGSETSEGSERPTVYMSAEEEHRRRLEFASSSSRRRSSASEMIRNLRARHLGDIDSRRGSLSDALAHLDPTGSWGDDGLEAPSTYSTEDGQRGKISSMSTKLAIAERRIAALEKEAEGLRNENQELHAKLQDMSDQMEDNSALMSSLEQTVRCSSWIEHV